MLAYIMINSLSDCSICGTPIISQINERHSATLLYQSKHRNLYAHQEKLLATRIQN